MSAGARGQGAHGRRRRPHRLGDAVRAVRAGVEPATLLAAAQAQWTPAVGERIAAESEPVAERDGVLTVACTAATWAQELDLLQDELLERLNASLAEAGSGPLRRLRFVATPPPG
ncbi:MAG: DciA family protein [Solirubrobacterales bacterium]